MSKRFVRLRRHSVATEPGARLRLERLEDETLSELHDEVVWPERVDNPDAHHIRETYGFIVLGEDDARWLHAALSELLAETGSENEL